MTFKTCKIQYEAAKKRDDKDGMIFWAHRGKVHGGIVEEPKKPEPKEAKK